MRLTWFPRSLRIGQRLGKSDQYLRGTRRRRSCFMPRQQSTLGLDVQAAVSAPELLTAQGLVALSATSDDTDGAGFADDLDDDLALDDGHFYDDVLEDA